MGMTWRLWGRRKSKLIDPVYSMPPESVIAYPEEDTEASTYPVAYRWFLEYDLDGKWRPIGSPYEDPRFVKSIREFRENEDPDSLHRYVRATITYEVFEDIPNE